MRATCTYSFLSFHGVIRVFERELSHMLGKNDENIDLVSENILSNIPISARGKHEQLAARWPHVDPRRHCNVKSSSLYRIAAYSGFSGSHFHVFQYKIRYIEVSKKKYPLFV